MRLKTATPLFYVCAAGATSGFLLFQYSAYPIERVEWLSFVLRWLFLFPAPLLFAFAYPQYIFGATSGKERRIFALALNGLGAAITLYLFLWQWRFLYDLMVVTDTLRALAALLAALPVYLAAAVFLLVRGRSSLALFASLLTWPFGLLLSVILFRPFFYNEWDYLPTYRIAYVLCVLSPNFLAFAAGAIPHRPRLAHSIAAMAGVMSMPWLYRSEFAQRWWMNSWISFNMAPDGHFGDLRPQAWLTILTISLIVLATATAACRLLPQNCEIRKSRLCEWTWPALATTVLVLAVWFRISVVPYRLPGMVDVAGFPIFQVLHIQKHGLQFHETCVSASDMRRNVFSVSRTDRRLFQYRFQQASSGGVLLSPLMERVNALLQSTTKENGVWDESTPLRAWNADGWYVLIQGRGFRVYTTENRKTPSPEIVALFRDIAALPHSGDELQAERRDVCFGFCYDPLAGMGIFYSNHRCMLTEKGVICH